jgi:protein TonB
MTATRAADDESATGGGRAMEDGASTYPLFESRVGEEPPRGRWAWLTTLALHGLAALAIVVVPLLAAEQLPPAATQVQAFFVAPQLAPPAPPPPPPAARASAVTRVAPPASSSFSAPVEMPQTLTAEPSLDTGLDGGVPGGVEGGVPGGVVGGVVGGIEAAPPPPQLVRVGGLVHEPRKIRDKAPVYPLIAKRARVQGVVILECVINTQGRVEGVKVLRGLPMLDEAAVDAVKQWVYTPTLVGGVPAEVVMTVTVNFVLRDAVLS